MLSRISPHLIYFSRYTLGAMLLGSVLLSAGCHQSADPDAGTPPVSLMVLSDTPTTFPATSDLFALSPTAAPSQGIGHAVLPPRSPDVDQVARQALAPVSAPLVTSKNEGLIVCDPVPASPSLSPFGNGCGRWLDLVAAGQPELGRTPLWEARGRAQQEMGCPALVLTPAQAVPLAAMTGATISACGTIKGTPALCTLTYQLYAIPSLKPIGLPVTQKGSEAQVLAALPAVARTLNARLGIHSPRIPASVGLSPAELTQALSITAESSASDADLLTLAHLSARSPLPGMYYLNTRANDDQMLLNGMVKTLLTQLPSNTLVLSHIAYTWTDTLRPYAAATTALMNHYPGSALLAHTQVWEQRVWGTRAGEYAAGRRAVTDAPNDPDVWLSLSATIGNIANDLRQDRLTQDLSPAEWAMLGRLYPQWERGILRATTLDSRDGHAWLQLAEAATFAGDDARAATAFSQALPLDANKEEVYDWGLQMYQPKWDGDPAALSRIAALAVAQPWDNSTDAVETADNLGSARLKAQADQVLSAWTAREQAAIAKSPTDVLAHWGLAYALAAQDTPPSLREATLEYRIAEHLMPRSPEIHTNLADVLDQRHQTNEAIAEYRQALALDPFNTYDHFSLGYDLKHERRFSEALSELRLAMRLNPRDANVHDGLGGLLYMQHQYKAASTEFREAIRMQFYSLNAWANLPGALDECGQYTESLQEGQEADHLLTEQEQTNAEMEVPLHDTMADDYLHEKDWTKSLAQSHVALGYNPNDACGHENLAEAYIGQGNKNAAHLEWQRAIAIGDPAITPVAKKLLAAHP